MCLCFVIVLWKHVSLWNLNLVFQRLKLPLQSWGTNVRGFHVHPQKASMLDPTCHVTIGRILTLCKSLSPKLGKNSDRKLKNPPSHYFVTNFPLANEHKVTDSFITRIYGIDFHYA